MQSGENDQNEDGHSRSPPFLGDNLFDDGVKDEFNRIFANGGSYFGTPSVCDRPFPVENFPDPTLANLETIEGLLQGPPSGSSREAWMQQIQTVVCANENELSGVSPWLIQLCASFEMAVECEAELCLETLFEIVKSLFLNGTVILLTRLVQNDFVFESILGILVCDPEVPQRVNHMEYLLRGFKSVYPISDPDTIAKIKILLRLNYVKDSVLARMLDDCSYYTFSQTAHLLNSGIFAFLFKNGKNFLADIIATSAEDTSSILGFIASVNYSASKQMLLEEKNRVFELLASPPVLKFLTDSPGGTEIILSIGVNAPAALRQFAAMDNGQLLRRAIRDLHAASDNEAEASQLADLIRLLLEPPMESLVFYEDEMLRDLLAENASFFVTQMSLDLVAWCVCSHQARGYILRCGFIFDRLAVILAQAVTGTGEDMGPVWLGAIRLARAFVWQKDPLYFKQLLRADIVSLLILCVERHHNACNMIYSGVLEILTFVCVNDLTFFFDALTDEDLTVLARLGPGAAHRELADCILKQVEKLRRFRDDSSDSRQSITSSRGRSVSPQPLRCPLARKRELDESEVESPKKLRQFI